MIPKDQVESGAGRRCWVNATFFGATEDEVGKKKKRYFSEFDPRGYDTRIVEGPKRAPEGHWYVHITRYSTCN